MRIISVVIGEKTSANRFDDVRTMFDYAFANYTVTTIYDKGLPLDEKSKVRGGKTDSVSIYPSKSVYAFIKRGEKPNITLEKRLETIKAPIKEGSKVGELLVFKDGVEYERVDLLVGEKVGKATVKDSLKKIAKQWNR